MDEFGVGGVGCMFCGIVLMVMLVILLGGVILYYFGFDDIFNCGECFWVVVFYSILVYNNVGFGFWNDSFECYCSNGVVNVVVMLLIVVGGLGWWVISDLIM